MKVALHCWSSPVQVIHWYSTRGDPSERLCRKVWCKKIQRQIHKALGYDRARGGTGTVNTWSIVSVINGDFSSLTPPALWIWTPLFSVFNIIFLLLSTAAWAEGQTNTEQPAVPERPWADVSSESWTSSACPPLPGWRLHPRQSGYKVWLPWTEQSGRSGCWGTGRLQRRQKRAVLMKIYRQLKHPHHSVFPPLAWRPRSSKVCLVLCLKWDSRICLIFLIHGRSHIYCSPLQNNPSLGKEWTH